MRASLASQHSKNPSAIYTAATLELIATHLPSTVPELKSIRGVGSRNIAYAESVFSITQKYRAAGEPLQEGGTVSPLDIKKSIPKPEAVTNVAPSSRSRVYSATGLCEEQLIILHRVLEGRNTFISGSAGTGKTFLLKLLIKKLTEKFGEEAVGVTASTGIAALNINGQTLHSFGGIGLASGSRDEIYATLTRNRRAVKRWRGTKVLIVDEISMCDVNVFEMLNEFAQRLRKSILPFGGIQVVLVGDFLQLPPVKSKQFCFESAVWEQLGLNESGASHILKQVWRQREQRFVEILNAVRVGNITTQMLSELNACSVLMKPVPTDGIQPTKLYCVNIDVDKENAARLKELPGEEEEFEAQDRVLGVEGVRRKQLIELAEKVVSKSIVLKVGAQVMLMRNSKHKWKSSHAGLVNGQRGVVIRYGPAEKNGDGPDVPIVRFDSGAVVAISPVEWEVPDPNGEGLLLRYQIPLKLAWAVTVHKSQGTTLSRAELLVANAFDYGQAYTALSRVTSLKGLWLTRPLTLGSIRTHPRVLQFYSNLQN